MPAKQHTRLANTPKRVRMWTKVKASALSSGKSKGAATRIANGVVKRDYAKSRTSSRGKRSR